jgi:hypothetical protein
VKTGEKKQYVPHLRRFSGYLFSSFFGHPEKKGLGDFSTLPHAALEKKQCIARPAAGIHRLLDFKTRL